MYTTSTRLLLNLLRGDKLAAEEFAALYLPLLARWAHRRGAQHADADDIAQDIVMRLLRAPSAYNREVGSFRGYLSVAVRRAVIDSMRKRKQARQAAASDEQLAGVATEDEIEALEEIEHRRVLRKFAEDAVLPTVGLQTQEVYRRRVNGEKSGLIAKALGIDRNAVYQAYHRVVVEMRRVIEGLEK